MTTAYPTATIIPKSAHSIHQKNISQNALKVLKQLTHAGYEAYLVGGGVRDLLLGLIPKDFDVSTNASPEQVRNLFKNSRIIGRRFKIAHVFFGREIIEVATFRADQAESDDPLSIHKHNVSEETGMITRDNVYGTIDQDAIRRDFTVNALYYNASNETIVDFLDGIKALKNREMNLIGDAATRYREDPVRMLRAVRLATKLQLNIEKKSLDLIPEMAHLLGHISSARLWEESLKLFLAGQAQKTWERLVELKLAEALFPLTIKSLEHADSSDFNDFIQAALQSTDLRIQQSKPVTPAFLFAVLLWEPVQTKQASLEAKGTHPSDAFFHASSHILSAQHPFIAIPKRFTQIMREIWQLQPALEKRLGKRAQRVFEHPRFRAAYDFLVLRAKPNSPEERLAEWWTEYQKVDVAHRHLMVIALGKTKGNKPNRRKKNLISAPQKELFRK